MGKDKFLSSIGIDADFDLEKEDEFTLNYFSKQYYQAAEVLRNSKEAETLWHVTYFLYGHSLELSYKSYLYSLSYGLDRLKKIGHNLDKALEICLKESIDSHVKIDEQYLTIVKKLNEHYFTKEFEYMTRTNKTFPTVWMLSEIVNKTILGVEKQFDFPYP